MLVLIACPHILPDFSGIYVPPPLSFLVSSFPLDPARTKADISVTFDLAVYHYSAGHLTPNIKDRSGLGAVIIR